MSPGEYKAASLGSLVVMLVVLGIWAVIWGPDEGGDNDQSPVPAVDEPADEAPDGNTDGPLIRASLPYDDLGQEALVGGTLLLREGCLVFEHGDGVEAGYLPIIWPGGTVWDEDTEEVVLPDGARVGIGDEVAGGGGYPYAEELGWLDVDAQALAQRCAESEWNVVARFNNQAEAAQTVD